MDEALSLPGGLAHLASHGVRRSTLALGILI